MNAPFPIAQHYAPSACPVAGEMETVQRWRKALTQAQATITQVQTEIDQSVYGNGKMDTFNLEDASNRIEVALDHMGLVCTQVDRALQALRKEMNRLQDGE